MTDSEVVRRRSDSSRRPQSVDAVARSLGPSGLPHPVLVEIARSAIAAGDVASAGDRAEFVAARLLTQGLKATGVLLHTGQGRAPLMMRGDLGRVRYANLELDMVNGERGSRNVHAAALIAQAAGAEAATIVNNGAGAVLLVLA